MDPRIMLDSLDAGVAAIGPDWTIAEWSAPAARITGLAAERVVGRNFWSAFPAAKSTPLEQTLRDVLADGEPRMLVTPARAPELADTVCETRVTRAPGNYLLMLFRRLAQEGGPGLLRPRYPRRSTGSADSTRSSSTHCQSPRSSWRSTGRFSR